MKRKELNQELKKETKSISINNTTIERVTNYPNYSYGMGSQPFSYKVEEMLNSLHNLLIYSTPELANYFTVDEAAAICDIENGVLHSSNIEPKKALYLGVLGGCEYEFLDLKWNIDKKQLLNKISNLTQFQAYMVQLLAAKFWDKNLSTFTMKDIAEIFYIDYEEELESESK